MAMKSEWMTDEEILNLKLNEMSDDQIIAQWGFSEYAIGKIRKSARHIQEISQREINGMRVPTHMAMYLMHAQARKSRDYHYLNNRETGRILQKIYISNGAYVDRIPENSYELSLRMSDIPERPTYRDLLESFINQMRMRGH